MGKDRHHHTTSLLKDDLELQEKVSSDRNRSQLETPTLITASRERHVSAAGRESRHAPKIE